MVVAPQGTQLKQGYRPTELGMIPEDWEIKTAEEICIKIQDGTHFSPKLEGNDYLYVTSKNIKQGVLDVSDAERIGAAEHRSIYARSDVKQGDLLLTKDGANTGNAAINYLDEEFSLLSSVAFLRFNPNVHEPAYYLQYILSSFGQTRIKQLMSGNAITRLTLEKIRKFRFLVPPLHEQCAIAAVLSDVDDLIASLDRLIAKRRDIKQATMQRLLTGKARVPGFSGEWHLKTLGAIADVKTGPFGAQLHESDYVRDGTPIITVEHLGEFGIDCTNTPPMVSDADRDRLKQYSLREGDIVFSRVGSIDRNALVRQDEHGWLFSGRLLRIRIASSVCPEFLSRYFQTEQFKQWIRSVAVGQTMASLNTVLLRAAPIAIPELSEQREIAAILSDIDADIAALEQRRDKTRALKQGMMQELLTGKTRLL